MCVDELTKELLRSVREHAPPNVVLTRLLVRAEQAADARRAIHDALAVCVTSCDSAAIGRIYEIERLWDGNPDAWKTVRTIGCGHARPHPSVDHALDYWSAAYDEAARVSPEASVALYSLGNAELLNAATAEIISFLHDARLLGPECRLLELGCGIGRLIEALALQVGLAVGVDISGEMVRHAAKRCQRFDNVRIARCSGRDLALFSDSSFDVFLAADVFPYIFEAGPALVRNMFGEASRVLAPNGALALLNFSYRSCIDADRAEVGQLADAAGFDLIQNGIQPFQLWDGLAFVLKKQGAEGDYR